MKNLTKESGIIVNDMFANLNKSIARQDANKRYADRRKAIQEDRGSIVLDDSKAQIHPDLSKMLNLVKKSEQLYKKVKANQGLIVNHRMILEAQIAGGIPNELIIWD